MSMSICGRPVAVWRQNSLHSSMSTVVIVASRSSKSRRTVRKLTHTAMRKHSTLTAAMMRSAGWMYSPLRMPQKSTLPFASVRSLSASLMRTAVKSAQEFSHGFSGAW